MWGLEGGGGGTFELGPEEMWSRARRKHCQWNPVLQPRACTWVRKVGVSVMMIMVVVVVVVVVLLLLLLLLRDVARRVLAQLCQCTLSAYRAFAPVYHPRMTTKSA